MMGPVWLIVGLAVLAVSIVFFIILFRYRIRHIARKRKAPKHAQKTGAGSARDKAIRSIDRIIGDLSRSKIDLRESYQQLSMVMRIFVTEITGKDVTSLTLTELRTSGQNRLSNLIAKWYAPEFALKTRADFMNDAKEAKQVVKSWK